MRLEIVGSLWATLEVADVGRLVDISPLGALVAMPVAVEPDSTQTVRLTIDGREHTIEARVRHSRRTEPGGNNPVEYLVGLEFLTAPDDWAHALS
jgi:hypothetical protein